MDLNVTGKTTEIQEGNKTKPVGPRRRWVKKKNRKDKHEKINKVHFVKI